jgi:hypothetical protein
MAIRSVFGLAILIAAITPAGAEVPVYVEGEPLSTGGIEASGTGRLLIPMRAIFTALGAKVEWDAKEHAVYAWKPDRTGVRLAVGAGTAQTMTFAENPAPGAWGTTTGDVKLDIPAVEQGGRVFVPLRFVAETFGRPVRYVESGPYVAVGTRQPQILTEAPVYCGSFTVFVVRGPGCGPRASHAMDVINDYLGGRIGKVTLQTAGKNIRILLNGAQVVECSPADAVREGLPSVKSLAQNWSRSLDSAFQQTKAQI